MVVPPQSRPPARKRSFAPRYSLASLLGLMIVAAGTLSIWQGLYQPIYQRAAARKTLLAAGGRLETRPQPRSWRHDLFDESDLVDVLAVDLSHRQSARQAYNSQSQNAVPGVGFVSPPGPLAPPVFQAETIDDPSSPRSRGSQNWSNSTWPIDMAWTTAS